MTATKIDILSKHYVNSIGNDSAYRVASNPNAAASITMVENQPSHFIFLESVNLPITFGFVLMNMIKIMIGTATIPLMTAE
jgi:hypothetical protein